MASPALELRSASVTFSENAVLRDIRLAINESEIFVLIGPSGQGKSVLLKLLAGLIKPTSGELIVEGDDFFKLSDLKRDQLRRRMGMLFQKNALFDSLTAAENIAFPLRETTALTEAQIDKKVRFFLAAVGLAHAYKLNPNELSGGMQKRLGIARALALDPEIIFYDDPTAGLDPITRRKIIDLILGLARERKTTVVAVTNDMNRAYQMAHRIAMVVDHGLIVTGTPMETEASQHPKVHQFVRGGRK